LKAIEKKKKKYEKILGEQQQLIKTSAATIEEMKESE
jgi:hypothetical protein